MKRADAIRSLARALPDHLVVCYAGAACEELYASGDEARFLYVLGSMGLSTSVGLGIALTSRKPVVALEGDASILMNLGSLVTAAQRGRPGFILAIVDNGQNASTGGQPTATASGLDLATIARAVGFGNVVTCASEADIATVASAKAESATFLHLRVEPGDGPRSLVSLDPLTIRDRARRTLTQ